MLVGQNNKMKLLRLIHLFQEKTDESHGLTIEQIIEELDKDGIHAERKSIYEDVKALNSLNRPDLVIEKRRKDRTTEYYLKEHAFTKSELRILVDAVAGSKFLTEELSKEITSKVERLGSVYQATTLKRNVYISDRPKSMNESIFTNINTVSNALSQAKRISFEYADWNHKKELVKRAVGGDKENISPCFLEFFDGNYYMIAVDDSIDEMRHYRVDKMQQIVIKPEKISETAIKIKHQSPASYSSKLTGMYAGEDVDLSLLVQKDKIGVVIDKFGKSAVRISAFPEDGMFTCWVKVEMSDLLLGWLAAVSSIITIKGPEIVKNRYKEMLKEALDRIE